MNLLLFTERENLINFLKFLIKFSRSVNILLMVLFFTEREWDMMSKKVFKKAPLPWPYKNFPNDNQKSKLLSIIRNKFEKIFGYRTNLSTKERKDWGAFLNERGILWRIRKPIGHDWEKVQNECAWFKPKGVDNYIETYHYYVPQDIAMKMLVLGELL